MGDHSYWRQGPPELHRRRAQARCRAEHCCAGAEGRRDRARTEAHGQGDSAAAAPGLAAAQPTAQAARAGCAGLNCTAWPCKGARRAPTHFVDQRAGHGIPAVLRCLHSHSQELVSAGCSLRLRQRTCAGWVAWTEPSILAEPVRGAVAQRGLPSGLPSAAHGASPRPCPGCLAPQQAPGDCRLPIHQQTRPSGTSWPKHGTCQSAFSMMSARDSPLWSL